MSLSSPLANALSGLGAARQALGVTANNVANVNTEGYSRKEVRQESQIIDGVGRGVKGGEVTRVVDEFLTAELRHHSSGLGRSAKLADVFERIERSVFGAPGEADQGMSARIRKLGNALEALAANPSGVPQSSSAVAAVEAMLGQIAGDAESVQRIRRDVDREIKHSVDAINGHIETIHELNGEIARSGGTAELLDRRDHALGELAGEIDIEVSRRDNGTIAVYTGQGTSLLEHSPKVLLYTPRASADDTVQFEPIRVFDAEDAASGPGESLDLSKGEILVTGGLRAEVPDWLDGDPVVSPLEGGRLQGLIEARDAALPAIGDQLDELATMVRFNLNEAHNQGVAQPPPSSLAARRSEAEFDAAARSGEAYLAVVDKAGDVRASLAIDVSKSLGDIVVDINQALEAELGPSTPPRARIEDDHLTVAFDDADPPLGLALDEGTSTIGVTDALGHELSYGFSHFLGLNDLVVAEGPKPTQLGVRPDIAAEPSRLATAALRWNGGDPVLGGPGDNAGAQKLASAMDRGFATVGQGGLAGTGNATMKSYAADVVSLAAARTVQAENSEAANRAMVDDLTARQGAVSGVNLDEELANLVLYQQAYSVSARVISATRELFDELLGIVR